MRHRHYAPKANMIIVEGKLPQIICKIKELVQYYNERGARVGILGTNETIYQYKDNFVKSLGSRKDLTNVAKNLFRLLREFDKENINVIIAEGVSKKGIGLAIMNRLRKAAGYKIIKVN